MRNSDLYQAYSDLDEKNQIKKTDVVRIMTPEIFSKKQTLPLPSFARNSI